MPVDVVPLAHGAHHERLVSRLRKNLLGWISANPDTSEPAARFLDQVEHLVTERLRNGPVTGSALASEIPELQVRVQVAPDPTSSPPMRIMSRVLELLAAEGRIARGRPTGRDFTSGSWTWEIVDDWLGATGIVHVEQSAALAGLVERYLRTLAPATLTDLAWWTGLPKGVVRAASERIGARQVELDSGPGSGFANGDDDLAAPTSDGAVALLPGLDSTTMEWKQRSWYVDDRPATGLFDRSGNAGPTVWLDGRVVGAWVQRGNGEVVTVVDEDVGSDARAAIATEAARIADWLGDVRVKWGHPTPLTKQLLAR